MRDSQDATIVKSRKRSRLLRLVFSPSLAFALVWSLAVFSWVLHWSSVMIPPTTIQVFFFFSLILEILLIWLVFFALRLLFSRPPVPNSLMPTRPPVIFLVCATVTWTTLFGLHWMALGYRLPILMQIPYTEFILPPWTGFMNSVALCGIALASATFWSVRGVRGKIAAVFFVAYFLCGSVAQLNRQVLIGGVLTAFFAWIISGRIRPQHFLFLLGMACGIVVLFETLGNMRSGSLGSYVKGFWPPWMPIQGTWLYLYIATPINNLAANIGSTLYFRLNWPACTMATLVPSFLRAAVDSNCSENAVRLFLVNPVFNVGTALEPMFSDLGAYGTLLFLPVVFVAVEFALFLCDVTVRGHKSARVLVAVKSILCTSAALTIFANLLFHIVYVMVIPLCALSLLGLRAAPRPIVPLLLGRH